MTVHIQCEGGGGVAQITLHRLNVVSGADRGNGVGVAQVVESGIGAAYSRHNAFVLAVNGGLRQVCADLVGKNQALRILPAAAQQKLLLHLPSTLLPQSGQDSLCRGNGTASAILG